MTISVIILIYLQLCTFFLGSPRISPTDKCLDVHPTSADPGIDARSLGLEMASLFSSIQSLNCGQQEGLAESRAETNRIRTPYQGRERHQDGTLATGDHT